MTTGRNSCAQTVLVVEDDPRIQTVIRILLEEEGFDVDAVDRAEDALDKFSALPHSARTPGSCPCGRRSSHVRHRVVPALDRGSPGDLPVGRWGGQPRLGTCTD
ncbi:MAG: response regulator [Actinobacteria bacterium ATB1]|nr:response regulator [Actinobacteria bacterium ATB1]